MGLRIRPFDADVIIHEPDQWTLVVLDPGCESADTPGAGGRKAASWWARNPLAHIHMKLPEGGAALPIRMLCLRWADSDALSADQNPLVPQSQWWEVEVPAPSAASDSQVRWLGWEANSKGKLGPRSLNLANFLDPARYGAGGGGNHPSCVVVVFSLLIC